MTGYFIDSGLDHGIFLNSDISQGSVVKLWTILYNIVHNFALFYWLTVYNLIELVNIAVIVA